MQRHCIVPCTLAHLRELATNLRPEDRREIEGAGLVVRHFLIRLHRRTMEPMAALVDGEVAACWGDEAGVLSDTGMMWLLTAPPVARLPLAFYREAKAEIARRLATRGTLVADVAADYDAAIRFFGMLGFAIGEPRAVPPRGLLYRRMTIARAF